MRFISKSSRFVLASVSVLLAYACDPGVFSRVTQTQSGRGGSAGQSGVAGTLDGMVKGGTGARDAGGDSGADADSDSGVHEYAADGGAVGAGTGTGTGGVAGSAGAAAGGGAGAAAGGAGAAGSHGCHPADLAQVKVVKLSDEVLQVPDDDIELVTGPAVLVKDRLLWHFGTNNTGSLQGQPIVAWADVDSLLSDKPKLSSIAGVVLPDEPLGNGLISSVTSAWPIQSADGEVVNVEFYFSRFYALGALSVGIGRADLDDPAPARVIVPPDRLFVQPSAAGTGGAAPERPVVLSSGRREGALFYAYACNPMAGVSPLMDPKNYLFPPCRLARVPAAQIQDGSSYEYWSDTGWVTELARASAVIETVPSGLTVRRNAFLNKQLAIHSGPDNDVRLAWADELQGPFHTLGTAIHTVVGTGGQLNWSSGASELPVPHGECDPEILIAYTLPVAEVFSDGSPARQHYEVHVLRLRLDP